MIAAQKAEAMREMRLHELEEERKMLAAASGPMVSTLERSLRGELQREHDEDAVAAIAAAIENLSVEELRVDEEDTVDVEFWEHGVVQPDTPIDADAGKERAKAELRKAVTVIKLQQAAFNELEMKFIKRAIYAHDLKRVYAKKRAQVKELAKAKPQVCHTAAAAR